MVRRYEAKDYDRLVAMFHSHNLSAPPPSHLPSIGFIEDDTAAGFIYLTDSAIAIIDNFVTAKQSKREERDKALDEIVVSLLDAAKSAGCEIVKCDTTIHAVKQRATAHGFDCIGSYQVFSRSV